MVFDLIHIGIVSQSHCHFTVTLKEMEEEANITEAVKVRTNIFPEGYKTSARHSDTVEFSHCGRSNWECVQILDGIKQVKLYFSV